jgi:hypothetical protein
MGTLPDSDAASDFSATNPLTKSFSEHHKESLQFVRMRSG